MGDGDSLIGGVILGVILGGGNVLGSGVIYDEGDNLGGIDIYGGGVIMVGRVFLGGGDI